MKLGQKKLVSLGLGGLLALTMVGCGSSSATSGNASNSNAGTSTETGEVEKPEKITMMVDATFCSVENGQKAITDKFKELTGVELAITSIDHNSYTDQLSLAFASGDVPDVVILNNEYYAAYATQGALADISSYWETSDLKSSDNVKSQYVDSLYINDGLYGFTAQRGNGCITYLRQDWLNNLGLEVPTTFEEYLNVLEAFKNNDPDGNGKNDTFGVTAAGVMGTSAPFTNYLPEFWQGAYPDFYKTEDGTWVDGFGEQATADALQRLKDAYAAGLIDSEVSTNKTSSCRDKFYASKVGAFTYWAGKWSATLEDNLKAITPEAELVAIPPIAELGNYVERQAPVLAITNKCKNPAGVFKYLFETMLDGGEGQLLFSYGVEGTHYEMEDAVLKQLPSLENPSTTFTTAYVDPLLTIATWEDPAASLRDPRVAASNETFVNNAKLAPLVVSNDTMANYSASLLDIRTVLVTNIVTGDTSVEEGMASYKQQAQSMVDEILASLNN